MNSILIEELFYNHKKILSQIIKAHDKYVKGEPFRTYLTESFDKFVKDQHFNILIYPMDLCEKNDKWLDTSIDENGLRDFFLDFVKTYKYNY